MAYIISSGITSEGVILENDFMTVLDGGTANNTIINAGDLYVSSGGTANSTIMSGGHLYVSNGGTANSTTVNSDGRLVVFSDGKADSATINQNGILEVYEGGTAAVIAENGGYVFFEEDTEVSFASNSFSGLVLSSLATVHSGTTATDTTLESNGGLEVFSGGTADGTTVNEGGGLLVFEGGAAENTTVNSFGAMVISYDGTANNVTVNACGEIYVDESGTAENIIVNSGGFLNVFYGTAIGTVENGGYVYAEEGVEVTFAPNTISGLALENTSATVHSGTTATGTTLKDNGWLEVFSGGSANDTTVGTDGVFFVYSGGSADNTIVNANGLFIVSNGASANNATVNSGGRMEIKNNGTANGIVENGGYVYLTNNDNVSFASNTINGMVLEKASATIHSGTTATGAEINAGGSLHLFSGGIADGAQVHSAGKLIVSSGGIVTGITVSEGGTLSVGRNGTAEDTVLEGTATESGYKTGICILSYSGMANRTTVNTGGSLNVSGGTANNTTVNDRGSLLVFSGGTAINATVNAGGSLDVYYGGILTGMMTFADDAVVSVAANAIVEFDISALSPDAPARINNFSLIQGTPNLTLTVSDTQEKGVYTLAEGVAQFDAEITVRNTLGDHSSVLTFDGGAGIGKNNYTMVLEDDALKLLVQERDSIPPVISNIQVSTSDPTDKPVTVTAVFTDNNDSIKSAFYRFGEEDEWYEYTDGIKVYHNGTVYLKAVDTDDNESEIASCTVANIGNLTGLIVSDGMDISILEGETFLDTVVISGGAFSVETGGTANDTTVSSGGIFSVFDGGTAAGVTVNAGADLEVYAGGTATDIVWTPCEGSVNIHPGATATIIGDYSGVYYGSEGHLISHANEMSSITLDRYGEMFVMTGGAADHTTVNSSGHLDVSSGGTATGAVINNSGAMTIFSGAEAADATVNAFGRLVLSSGGTANDTTINTFGQLVILSGGTATGTLLSGGAGWDNKGSGSDGTARVIVSSGGIADNTVVQGLFACLHVSTGGVANKTTVNRGCSMSVLGSANDITLDRGSLDVSKGGFVNGVDVNKGYVWINGGTVTGIVENGGFVDDFFRGRGYDLTFVSNTFSGLVLDDWATVHSGTTACRTTVGDLAWLCVLSGGIASDTTVFPGESNSRMSRGLHVFWDGIADGVTVHSGGSTIVSSGGTAANVTLLSGGSMIVSSGAVNGIKLLDGARLTINQGSFSGRVLLQGSSGFSIGNWFTYDLTQTSPGGIALISDLSLAGGSACAVMVADDQAEGIYSLADGADKFTGSLSLYDTSGRNLRRNIALGETVNVTIKDKTIAYTLFLSCGDLYLAVGCEVPEQIVYSGIDVTDKTVVSSGEIYSNATISNRGLIRVSSGGTATRTIVNAGRTIEVSGGGLAKRTQIRINGILNVFGGLAVNTVNSGGSVAISGGGSAYNTIVRTGGTLIVSKGGTADDSVLSDTCSLLVSGGIANDTVVYGQGTIEDGGVANRTMLYEGAILDISSGGSVGSTVINRYCVMNVSSCGTAESTVVNSKGQLLVSGGGVANNTSVFGTGSMTVAGEGTAKGQANATILYGGSMFVSRGGVADGTTVHGQLTVFGGGTATAVKEAGGVVTIKEGAEVTFASHTFSGAVLYNSATVHSGTTAVDVVVMSRCTLEVFSGGSILKTLLGMGERNGYQCKLILSSGGMASDTNVNAYGMMSVYGTANDIRVNSGGDLFLYDGATVNSATVNAGGRMRVAGGIVDGVTVKSGGIFFLNGNCAAADIIVNSGGRLYVSNGTADGISVRSAGSMFIENGGRITGKMSFASGAFVSGGGILDFDLTQAEAGAEALVNDLSVVQGTPQYTLTVDGTEETGVYTLADGAANFKSTISVVNRAGDELGTLTVGETLTIDKTDYLLTNENGVLSVTVTDGKTPTKPKWTYMVYMAADSNIGTSALYDIIGMQQAEVDSEIDIYVLADRCAVDAGYPDEIVTVNGTYKWDSLWPDTRVGKITYSPGLTVTVDWESWGELDTASSETLKRFVDWVQEESPAENYGLILWDHGEEDGELCWDLTTDPNWNACFKVSEVSDLLNEKGNIPIVIFNNCLLASEIVATQLAGSTEVIVASEPVSMGESTYNYHAFFNTITAGMTPQEVAEIMVRNVISPGMLTMLSSIDVRDSRLGDALEALADAVAEADNDADKTVLTNAMLKAYQDGFCYTGSLVQQSDLGYMIQQAMADGSFDNTSEGFKKALADVKTVLEEVVLAVRSVPVKRGTGIAYCNTIATLLQCAVTGRTPEKMDSLIKSHIISSYKSNPLWGGLLYDLGSTFLNRNADQLFRPASFHVIDVEGLVEGRTVAAMDLGCFSGMGEQNYGIALIGDAFCRIVITDEDKSTGIISVGNESGKEIKVSLLAADGSIVVAENTNGISFENLAPGDYYIRLLSETNCDVTVTFDANWMTGVDRFDYAGSGQNLPGVNGNGSIDTATILDAGYYTGLLTCKGDTDYYRVGNIHTEQYTVVINGREDWTVAEYDENGTLVREGQYSELDNYITLTMDSMNYLLVEGTADPSKQEVNRYFLNIFKNKNGSGGVVQLDDLTGSKDEVSWESSTISEYVLECSTDGFEHALQYTTSGTAVDLLNLPAGTYQWRVKANMDSAEWNDGNEIVSDNTSIAPKVFRSKADASDDIFFATPVGTWDNIYYAQNVGSVNDWTGTNEIVSANGKGRIQDLFFGSADPSTLCLTDSENGDALFLDDMYTGLPEDIEDNTGRLFRLQSIMAGAGDDIIDMTSQRFEYSDGNLSLFGGDGDDIIWASKGKNMLFGDAGNDRIVGASSNDVIAGGIGNDRMHGGGGDDVFTFCDNWGADEVEQLGTGKVTLWFAESESQITASELDGNSVFTNADGTASVTVKGFALADIAVKYGDDGTDEYKALAAAGAFEEFTSQKIFEESGKGLLA